MSLSHRRSRLDSGSVDCGQQDFLRLFLLLHEFLEWIRMEGRGLDVYLYFWEWIEENRFFFSNSWDKRMKWKLSNLWDEDGMVFLDEIIENDRFLILEGFERNCKEFFVYFVKRGDLKKMSWCRTRRFLEILGNSWNGGTEEIDTERRK